MHPLPRHLAAAWPPSLIKAHQPALCLYLINVSGAAWRCPLPLPTLSPHGPRVLLDCQHPGSPPRPCTEEEEGEEEEATPPACVWSVGWRAASSPSCAEDSPLLDSHVSNKGLSSPPPQARLTQGLLSTELPGSPKQVRASSSLKVIHNQLQSDEAGDGGGQGWTG